MKQSPKLSLLTCSISPRAPALAVLVLAVLAPGVALGQEPVQLPDSPIELHLWRQIEPAGTHKAFYAVTDGGTPRGRARSTSNEVRLRHHRFDPLGSGVPAVSGPLAARPENRLYLVQLHAPPLPEHRQAITSAGGTVLSFLTDHTFLVEATAADLPRIATAPWVRWVGPYHPLYRLEEPLREAILGQGLALPRQRYSMLLNSRGTGRQLAVAERVRGLGGQVDLIEPGGLRVEATLTQDQLLQVAHDDAVHFIDRWGGPGEPDMDIIRQLGGADYVESVGGFTGQGVTGEVFDTELLLSHQEWLTPPLLHSVTNSCGILHGTGAYSNVFAGGTDPAARGMLPDGRGIFFCFDEATQFGGPTSRYDINAELIDPAGPYRRCSRRRASARIAPPNIRRSQPKSTTTSFSSRCSLPRARATPAVSSRAPRPGPRTSSPSAGSCISTPLTAATIAGAASPVSVRRRTDG